MPVVRIILSIYFLHHARYLVVIPPLVAIPVRQKRKLQRWKQERWRPSFRRYEAEMSDADGSLQRGATFAKLLNG